MSSGLWVWMKRLDAVRLAGVSLTCVEWLLATISAWFLVTLSRQWGLGYLFGKSWSSMTKGSDLFVAALENEGVERIFGVPGEENLDTVESLRYSSIELMVTRHEQSAAFMAATYGRLTGRPGVCIRTLGPGALNLATGAAYAHLGAMPMILITGQKAIMSSQQARFQIVDMVATMKPLTKFSRQIVSDGEHSHAGA